MHFMHFMHAPLSIFMQAPPTSREGARMNGVGAASQHANSTAPTGGGQPKETDEMTENIPTPRLTNAGEPADFQADTAREAAFRRELGIDGDAAEPRQRQPQRQPFRAEAGLRADQLGRLTSRPDWHRLATPPEVGAAWGRVLELASAVRRAHGDVQQLDADRRSEEQKATAAARTALDAGQAPAAAESVDWASEELTRRSRWAAVTGQLRQAHADYLAAAEEALPEWQRSITDRLPELQERARGAVAAAASAVATWRAAVDAAVELERHRDEPRVIRNTAYVTQAARQALAGADLSGAVALTSSDDPIVTASWIAAPDERVDPPVHVRRAMNESNNTVQYLAAIEAEEGFRVTAFTRDDWGQMFPTPEELEAPSAPPVLGSGRPSVGRAWAH
ncbi:MAG: hypothetical protein JWP61_1996 [Friedmanniella sp.]|nr:hypothetical protein [Friedmanniella sp.]